MNAYVVVYIKASSKDCSIRKERDFKFMNHNMRWVVSQFQPVSFSFWITLRAKYGGVCIKYSEESTLVWASSAATCSVQAWTDFFLSLVCNTFKRLAEGFSDNEWTDWNMRRQLYLCSFFGGLFCFFYISNVCAIQGFVLSPKWTSEPGMEERYASGISFWPEIRIWLWLRLGIRNVQKKGGRTG